MPLTKTLRASLQDFTTLGQTLDAGIEMNTSLLGLAERWFDNVEIVYPIAEMPIEDDQRNKLARTVLSEMCASVTNTISTIESGSDPDDVMPSLAVTLDGLWRELTGLYAPVLNKRFAETTAGVDPQEVLDQIREGFRVQAEMLDMDEEEIRDALLSHDRIRAELRQLGIDPDSL